MSTVMNCRSTKTVHVLGSWEYFKRNKKPLSVGFEPTLSPTEQLRVYRCDYVTPSRGVHHHHLSACINMKRMQSSWLLLIMMRRTVRPNQASRLARRRLMIAFRTCGHTRRIMSSTTAAASNERSWVPAYTALALQSYLLEFSSATDRLLCWLVRRSSERIQQG